MENKKKKIYFTRKQQGAEILFDLGSDYSLLNPKNHLLRFITTNPQQNDDTKDDFTP